jgi:hypothetical protein
MFLELLRVEPLKVKPLIKVGGIDRSEEKISPDQYLVTLRKFQNKGNMSFFKILIHTIIIIIYF